jgi:hypothetical protein
MIVIEHKLAEIFDGIPEISLSGTNTTKKASFSWGSKEDLDAYIKESGSNCYPLIWLLPSEEKDNRRADTMTSRCVFILATLEMDRSKFNGSRWMDSFNETLNPLSEYIKKALDLSATTILIDPEDVTQLKKPNYSEVDRGEKSDGGTIDLWDAIRLEVEVEFNNNCFKSIRWD